MKRSLTWLSFVAGATVMAAEMAASRLLAPYFGSSTPVWAALIAFVLAGMATGASLGGRAADRLCRIEPLLAALAFVAADLALLPFLARALLSRGADALLSGHPFSALLPVAAFALAALPPVLVLGAVGPYLTRLSLDGVSEAGARAGKLSAASTAGSIAGTLLAAFAALPLLGTARTMALFGLVLGAAASLRLRWHWRVAALAVPVASLVLAPLALPRQPRALDAVESPFAFVQVLEHRDGARELIFDEGYAVQSVYRPGSPVRDEVFSHYLLAPAMAQRLGARPRVLLLGLGAGTAARGLLEAYPSAELVGVELDPEVVRLARKDFDLPEIVEVHVGDARAFLRGEQRRFDAIVLDAFRFPYVPFHLTTLELDQSMDEHLEPGGVVCVNVGRYGDERAVVDAVAGTLAQVFPEVLAADAHNHSNTLLFAGRPGLRQRLLERAASLPPFLQPLALRVGDELRPVKAASPLTDDRAPVELLTDGILLRSLWKTGGAL